MGSGLVLRAPRNDEKRQHNQQNNPTGKSLPIYRNRVKSQNQKYFAFPEGQISAMTQRIPSRSEGRIMIATNVGRAAVDAGNADNERRESVRQRRVVPTPRCWRQGREKLTLLTGDGGKRAVHRGELAISRKTTAQGMSDVLRCPVCSCAHFLCTLRMRPRVQRASGIPCALFFFEGERYLQSSGASCRENAKQYPRRPGPEQGPITTAADAGSGWGSNPFHNSH